VFQVDPWLIATVTIIVAALFAFVISRVVRIHRSQAKTGKEELIGKTAVVKIALDPEGTVFYKGERWMAISDKDRIEPGEEVIITKVEGLTLRVSKKE
jgi:membrane-bound serine protease (ClpP class)